MQKPKSEEWVLRAGGSDPGLHAAGSPWAGALRVEEEEVGGLSFIRRSRFLPDFWVDRHRSHGEPRCDTPI